jgi:hypothetical protein
MELKTDDLSARMIALLGLGALASAMGSRSYGRTTPEALSLKDLKTVRAMLKSGDIPVSTVAAQFRVARSTLYRNTGLKSSA